MEKGLILLTVQGTIHQCGKSQGSRSLRHLLTSHSLSRNNTECFLVLSLLSPFCAFWNALPLKWSRSPSRRVFRYQLTPPIQLPTDRPAALLPGESRVHKVYNEHKKSLGLIGFFQHSERGSWGHPHLKDWKAGRGRSHLAKISPTGKRW